MSETALVPIEGSEIVDGQWEETTLAPAPPSISELVDRFLESHDVRASSRATYKRMLKAFCSWLEESGRRLINMRREAVSYTHLDVYKRQQGLILSGVAGSIAPDYRLETLLSGLISAHLWRK